jgi:hypothetical protein
MAQAAAGGANNLVSKTWRFAFPLPKSQGAIYEIDTHAVVPGGDTVHGGISVVAPLTAASSCSRVSSTPASSSSS